MRFLPTLLVTVVAPLAAASAQSLIANPWGLQPAARTIDFGSGMFPDGTAVSTQFAGVSISHAAYFTSAAPNNNVVGGYLGNDVAAGPPSTVTIRFLHSITDVSFVYHQIGTQTPTTIRAKFQGGVVDLFSLPWNETQPNNFFGFVGGCWLDELEIDFASDFRIDSLAYNPVTGASCTYFNGSGVNPAGFGCVTPPILGGTWHATVFNEPNTLLTALVYSPAGWTAPVPLFGGELLLDPSQAFVAFVGTTDYSLAIPSASSWVGTTFTFQGVRLDLVGGSPALVPLNAMLILLGM